MEVWTTRDCQSLVAANTRLKTMPDEQNSHRFKIRPSLATIRSILVSWDSHIDFCSSLEKE
jgi:hypothetical protein